MFALALRNVFRHRTRSAVALSAIAFSTIALILSAGFIEWIFWAMRQAATEAGLGHIHVMRKGFTANGVADPFAYLMPEGSPQLSTVGNAPHVVALAPRLQFSGLVSAGDTTLAFVGTGVDPDKEAIVSKNFGILRGRNVSVDDPNGVILGEGLARQLKVDLGATIVLLGNTSGGSVNAVEGHVAGIFSTQIKAADDVALRVPIALGRRLMRVSGSHEWIVLLDNSDFVPSVTNALQSQLSATDLEVVPWYDLADFYNKTVTLLTSQMNVVRVMVGMIIVLGISNMLVMNVLERTGEIGTLMAMGSKKRNIIALFVSEGFCLGLLGGLFGLVIAFMLAHVVSTIGIPMPPPPGRSTGYSAGIRLTWGLCAVAFVVSFGTTLLASFYPAWKASRLVIVDALRHNR